MVNREVRRNAQPGYKDSTAATIEIMRDLYQELQESQFVRCIESEEDMIIIAQTGAYINTVTEETQDLTWPRVSRTEARLDRLRTAMPVDDW